MEDIRSAFGAKGFVRPQEGRVIAGVFAGLGRRFGLDPWPARLLFILVLLIIPGSLILIYPILWVLMPAEESMAGPPGPASTGGPTPPV